MRDGRMRNRGYYWYGACAPQPPPIASLMATGTEHTLRNLRLLTEATGPGHTPTEAVPGAEQDGMSDHLFYNSSGPARDDAERPSIAESGPGPVRGDGVRGSIDNTIQTSLVGRGFRPGRTGSGTVLP